MQAKFSAIGFGAFLACACGVASAAPTVTTIQEGNRNSAYVEQAELTGATATIVQIGNDNYAGDPHSRLGGIFQRAADFATATIFQQGNGNDAGIEQDGTALEVNARVDQVGNRNTGYITQYMQFFSDGSLSQTGNDNVAWLDQRNVDAGLRAVQTGSDNFLIFKQHGAALGPAIVTQTGNGNAMRVEQDNVLGAAGTGVTQIGDMNIAQAEVKDVSDAVNSILQIGNENTALTAQKSGGILSGVVTQSGDGNWAKLTQTGLLDTALITQTGDNNWARIKQVGDGFAASINQLGNGNSAGIYQH